MLYSCGKNTPKPEIRTPFAGGCMQKLSPDSALRHPTGATIFWQITHCRLLQALASESTTAQQGAGGRADLRHAEAP